MSDEQTDSVLDIGTSISSVLQKPSNLKWVKLSSLLVLLLMTIASVGLDQTTKMLAEAELMIWQHPENLRQYQGRPHYVWSTSRDAPTQSKFYFYLGFNYVRNQGAAWGILSNLQDNIRVPFFYGMTILAILLILYYLRSTPYGHRLARLALVLILSGAIGNFIDRLRVGYVIDWIDVRWNIAGWFYHFPNFNIADSCISVGVFLLIVDSLILDILRRRRLRLS